MTHLCPRGDRRNALFARLRRLMRLGPWASGRQFRSPWHVRVRDVLMSGYTRRVTSGGTERPVGCLAHGPDLAVAMTAPREQDWREPAVQLRSPRSRSAGSFARVTCDEISGSVP